MSLLNNTSPLEASQIRRAPILCYVTDRRGLALPSSSDSGAAILEKIETIAAAGVDWIQLREKDLSGRAAAALAHEALIRISKRSTAHSARSRLFINDRLDIALAEHAGGVHLGENSLAVAEAKRLVQTSQVAGTLAADFVLGASTHSLDSAKSAANQGAHYIFFGPVFATPSKAAYGAPQGLERLAEVCAAVNIPVLAIGGITLDNVGACFRVGAAGIAAIRLFQDATAPELIVNRIRAQFA